MAEVKTIKVGEPLTSDVDGNPDPSFLNTTKKEGVETRQWICLKCSNSFIPKTKRSKFCSTNCAIAFNTQAWRLRHNKIEKPGVGSGNNQFEKKNSQFKNGWTTYRRKGKELSQNKCNRCSSTSFLLIHHKNENRDDSREENLEMLCKVVIKDTTKLETIAADMPRKRHKGIARAQTKVWGNLLIYGMGASKLADTLSITIKEAKDFIEKYFKAFPKIKETLEYFTTLATKNQYAWSPLDGRRRLFSGIDWDDKGIVSHLMNIAKNQPFQGAGASVTKLALCWIKNEIDEHGWDAKITCVIHDEILVEVKDEIAETVAKVVKEKMIAAFNYYAPDVPMEVAPTILNHWAK